MKPTNSKFLRITLGLMAIFVLSSCSPLTYYQVYQVKSKDVPVVNEHFEFNNEDVRVRYNLCADGGDVTFYCYNKSDQIIYILLDNSFYVHNGIAYDYFKDCDYSIAVTTTSGQEEKSSYSASLGVSVSKSLTGKIVPLYGYDVETIGASANASVSRSNEVGYYNSKSYTRSVTDHATRIVAIPPHFAKFINGFTIQSNVILECGAEMHDQNYPKKSSRVFSFIENTTPITFSNHISYSFNQDGSDMQHFINNFYVSTIQNIAEKEIYEKNPNYKPGGIIKLKNKKSKNKSKDACAKNERYYFKIQSPTEFYKSYN